MKLTDANRVVFGTLVVVLSLVFWGGYLLASNDGVDGKCTSTTGCGPCHGDSPDANGDATVSIGGPTTVDLGTTNTWTISVSGGPQTSSTGGFNLCASSGTFTPGTGNKVQNGELVHSDLSRRSWTFEWTAPSTGAGATFTAVAMSTNGSGTSGDSWDWFGGAAGETYDIVLETPTPVTPTSWGLLKSRYEHVAIYK
jgi:hypothetical protein